MSSYDGLFARMKENLPDFKGYKLVEERQVSDKIARENLGRELRFSIDILKKQLNDNPKVGDSKKQVAETVTRKLNLLVEALDGAPGDLRFFQEEEIADGDIESILTMDLNLLTRSIAIKEKAIRISREVVNSPSWDKEVDELYNKLKDLDESWKRRSRLVSAVKT